MAGLLALGPPAPIDGRNMAGGDFAVNAGWSHSSAGDAVMLGTGSALERAYTPDERAALGGAQFRRARSLTAIVGP